MKSSCMRFRANISGHKLCPDRESNEDLQKSTKLRMGLNVSNIRVTNLEDRLPSEDESPTVCFSYGQEASSIQKSDHKKTLSASINHEKAYFSGTKQVSACPDAKCEQETQNDTQSQKQEKN